MPRGRWGEAPGVPTPAPADAQASLKVERKQCHGARAPRGRPSVQQCPAPTPRGGPPLLLCTPLGPALLTPLLASPPRCGCRRSPLTGSLRRRRRAVGRAGSTFVCWATRGRCSTSLNLSFLTCETEVVFPACGGGRRERMSSLRVWCLARDGSWRHEEGRFRVLGRQRLTWPPPTPAPIFLLLGVEPSRNAALSGVSETGDLLVTKAREGSGPDSFAVPFLQQKSGPIVVFTLPLSQTRRLRALTSF